MHLRHTVSYTCVTQHRTPASHSIVHLRHTASYTCVTQYRTPASHSIIHLRHTVSYTCATKQSMQVQVLRLEASPAGCKLHKHILSFYTHIHTHAQAHTYKLTHTRSHKYKFTRTHTSCRSSTPLDRTCASSPISACPALSCRVWQCNPE